MQRNESWFKVPRVGNKTPEKPYTTQTYPNQTLLEKKKKIQHTPNLTDAIRTNTAAAKSFQSCRTLCDPKHGNTRGFLILGNSPSENTGGDTTNNKTQSDLKSILILRIVRKNQIGAIRVLQVLITQSR